MNPNNPISPSTAINHKPRLMTVPTPATLNLGPFNLVGVSLAGCRTSLFIPDLRLCLDAGFPFPFQLGADTFFITHGHLDHAAAIPYIISQKNLNNQKVAQFYMPNALVEPLTKILRLWEEIELHNYQFEFIPTKPNTVIQLSANYSIRPFKAHHRVPTLGYTLFQKKKRLREEFLGLNKNELIVLKNKGVEIELTTEFPLMTFSGDSQIEFLWEHPWITDSEYLLVETTYIDDRKSTEQAREWGHIHLDELIAVLPQVKARNIILMHISSRYGDAEAKKIIAQKIPEEFRSRVHLFQGR